MPFVEVFDLLEYRFSKKWEMYSGDREDAEESDGKSVDRAESVSLKTKCGRVVRQVFSIGLNGIVKWPWSGGRVMRVKRWESKVRRR